MLILINLQSTTLHMPLIHTCGGFCYKEPHNKTKQNKQQFAMIPCQISCVDCPRGETLFLLRCLNANEKKLLAVTQVIYCRWKTAHITSFSTKALRKSFPHKFSFSLSREIFCSLVTSTSSFCSFQTALALLATLFSTSSLFCIQI